MPSEFKNEAFTDFSQPENEKLMRAALDKDDLFAGEGKLATDSRATRPRPHDNRIRLEPDRLCHAAHIYASVS